MNSEETQMPKDDRFVLRRGTTGDDWRAPDGTITPPSPSAGPLGRLKDMVRSIGRSLSSLFGCREPTDEAASFTMERPEEPGSGWAPMPALPEDPRVAVPWSKVAPPRPKLSGKRERFVTGRPRVAIPWAKIALARPKSGTVKQPKISVPKPSKPKLSAPKLPSVRMPKPSLPSPSLPRVRAPHMPKLKAAIPTFGGLASLRLASVRGDMRSPVAVLAGLALASLIALGAIVAITQIGGSGGDGGLVIETHTPAASEVPGGSPSGEPSASVAPSEGPTEEPTPTAAPETATPAPTEAPSAAPTAAPTQAPGGGGGGAASSPQGALGVALWANNTNQWRFGNLTGAVANYEEGQAVPFLVRWDGVAGATYWIRIEFDCEAPNVFGAIDYLSGLQSYDGTLGSAQWGPGNMRPDGAIPVPDISNFDFDDGNDGVFWLWNAKFPVLPLPPYPDDNCNVRRHQDIPIHGYGGPIIFLASAHLATATDYDSGEGASTVDVPFGLHISVDGVGAADVLIDPSAVADIER
jgi:hypothetical protein